MNRPLSVAVMSYAMDGRLAKGTALYTRKLIERLVEDPELDITLVHYEHVDDPLYQKAKEIIMPRGPLPFKSRFISQLLFFWTHRHQPFDIIHWCQPRLYPFFWLAPARALVATFHGGGDVTAGDRFHISRFVFNTVAKWFHGKLDVVVADSELGKQEIVEAYHMPERRVESIYIGGGEGFSALDPQASARLIGENYGLTKPYILCVSRLQRHKNIGTLIRAYIRARELGYLSEQLAIVGLPAGDEQELYHLARASAFSSDILFKQFVEGADLNALYAAARVFVFPSINEGFGLPLIEAMASGTPVIAAQATALPEIGGDAALFVDPYDAEALAEALRTVLTDTQVRSDLIVKGKERAKLFSWGRTAQETKALYRRIVSRI